METNNLSSNSEIALSETSDNSEITQGSTSNNSAVKGVYDKKYAPLYNAVRDGDLKEVSEFLEAHPEGVNAMISKTGETALHVATLFGHLHIVKELVTTMQEQDLELKDLADNTALTVAASTGMIEIAKCMIEKNKNLLIISTEDDVIPVTKAVICCQKEMARYLYSVTPFEDLVHKRGDIGSLFVDQCFYFKSLDLALDLVGRFPSLAITRNKIGANLVNALANGSPQFPSHCKLQFWQGWIYKWIRIKSATITKDIRINIERSNAIQSEDKMSKIPYNFHGLLHRLVVYIFDLIGIKKLYKLKLAHEQFRKLLLLTCNEIDTLDDFSLLKKADVPGAIFIAAKTGAPEFIMEALNVNPNLLLLSDRTQHNRNFFFFAIQYRQVKVFSLIYGVNSAIKDIIANVNDGSFNSALHMAAMLEPSTSTELNRIPGAALQMQRELQWFKEVENIMNPSRLESVNKDFKTARELFTEHHKDLKKEGEEWIKENATSCTVVAVLIVTMMFAASFTVPGGIDQNTGYPMFQDHKLFKLFMISDAVSLFSSTTSVLLFLGILTSRYDEDDFLKSLPTKLIIGLSMLFVSIATMMITYVATISIMLPGQLWIIIPVILFACVPVSSFAWLQFPLLATIYHSTYGRGIFERNMERWL